MARGAHRIGVDGSVTLSGVRELTGFLPSATGTVAVTVDGVAVVAATTATAGVWIPLPLRVEQDVTVTCAGSAAGTLFV